MAIVLIVDDDPAVGLTLARMLEADGHQAVLEETAAAGLDRIDQHPPDAVILDMRMPGLGGLDFLRALRRLTSGESLPLAVLTGDYFIRDEVLAELMSLGAMVWYKPVSMDDLSVLTRELLARKPGPHP